MQPAQGEHSGSGALGSSSHIQPEGQEMGTRVTETSTEVLQGARRPPGGGTAGLSPEHPVLDLATMLMIMSLETPRWWKEQQ